MQVITEAFTDQELALIDAKIPPLTSYRLNREVWDPELWAGHSGQVRIALADHWVTNTVVQCLNRYLPELDTRGVTVQHCFWGENSGLNPHRDSRYRWAATVYLNREWQAEWGGHLCWVDSEAREIGYVPVYNTVVVSDQRELHWVTPIVGGSIRRTLQIWAL